MAPGGDTTPPGDPQAWPGCGRGSLPEISSQNQAQESPNLPMLTTKPLQLTILAIRRPLAQSQGQLQHPWDHPMSRTAPHLLPMQRGGSFPPPGACFAKLGWGQSSSSSSSCHEDPPSVAKAGLSILETPSHSSQPQHVTPHIQASHEPSCKPPASQPRAKRVSPRGDVPGWMGPAHIPRSRAQALAAARSRGWRQHLSSP